MVGVNLVRNKSDIGYELCSIRFERSADHGPMLDRKVVNKRWHDILRGRYIIKVERCMNRNWNEPSKHEYQMFNFKGGYHFHYSWILNCKQKSLKMKKKEPGDYK